MEFSAEQLASLVNGVVDGDVTATVNSFAKIEEGHSGALSFIANPKYYRHIYDTKSSIVLVSKDFHLEHPVTPTLIRVSDPYAALAQLMTMASRLLSPAKRGIEQPVYISSGTEVPEDCYVGAFAYIGSGAVIGHNVQIYPQAYIGENVVIGDGSIIYSGVKIYNGCRIGKNCIIHAGAVIGADGFGFAPLADGSYEKIPQLGIVEIDDNVEIGANTTIDRATMGRTHISQGVKLDNLIQVAHNVEIGSDTVMAAQVGIAGSSKIGRNCMFGGQVGIAGHIAVGDRVGIAAQSGIAGEIQSDAKIMGSPAVNAKDYMRTTVYIKRLGELFERVANLEKINKTYHS